MGNINRNLNVYNVNGQFIGLGEEFIEKGMQPTSNKYPGCNTILSFKASKGKHVGSHKPIKNHRGKTIRRF